MNNQQTLAQTNNFIVLESYRSLPTTSQAYQTEEQLERELIQDLGNQGYAFLEHITSPEQLLANVRLELQRLNQVVFTDTEWRRFVEEYLDKPSDHIIEKTRKIHDDYIYDFTFDDGHLQNIYLVDKKHVARNTVQVIRQFEQKGTHANRYDVTILVNGLPLVHIELKKRGVAIRQAFNQIHRYSKESFNSDSSLYKYVQLFVISNGTDTRYFANTTERNKNTFDFTMHWARADNQTIHDLKDFTATFFTKNTLLQVLLTYSVLDSKNNLLVMRPYQIAATERILWKIKSSYNTKKWSNVEGGGYIWHTTGSGKTLTSFKAARLATELEFIDKVFFVVDRKDLDNQTMKEYQRFSPDSVNGSNSTSGLKDNLDKKDNRIIVTTIQKLNNLLSSEPNLPIYQQHVVFIFDEAHRSQFGEAQKKIQRRFKKYYQFGFTGTPIFKQNAVGYQTTDAVFGATLHKYLITDAIRDEKVLKFKVDYNDLRPTFKSIENETDAQKISAHELKNAYLHPERIKEITEYILKNYRHKTHRLRSNSKGGFNAMFAVSSVQAAKAYYECFKTLQSNPEVKYNPKPLRVATIFSFAANEEQSSVGEIGEEEMDIDTIDLTAKEFLSVAIQDYNALYGTNYNVESKEFENYYKNLTERVQKKEVDLLIVVGMCLTGFDAPTLNTLFVDKHLRYHGLIQAFSRTNRIYDATKSFGNIVTFRNLEPETIEAIKLFGSNANGDNIIIEHTFEEYVKGFTDITTGRKQNGLLATLENLAKFPNPTAIHTDAEKKEFVKTFGEYLRLDNILQNFDEYTALKGIHTLDVTDSEAVATFQAEHGLTKEEFQQLQSIQLPSEREFQDYCSVYNDIRDGLRSGEGGGGDPIPVDWSNVVFEMEILNRLEINLDYILSIIYEKKQEYQSKDDLIAEVKRLVRTSFDNRSKEELLVSFIQDTNLEKMADSESITEAFYQFAQKKLQEEVQVLIVSEQLDELAARRYIKNSLKKEYASENGADLKDTLPRMSPLKPEYRIKKQTVFSTVAEMVQKYKGVGWEGE